ncbi:MAG: site-specific integrase [Sphingomonadales bacterium]|jgi:integrase
MAVYQDVVDLRGDGRVILYKRHNLKNQNWQCRIRVPNATGYKVVSTKTDNQREAERFALDLYEDLYIHVKAGGSVQSKTFKQVFDDWKKHVTTIGHTRRGGSWQGTIDRVETYAVRFFGAMKIDAIGPTDFADFWAWRKSNFNRKQPSNGTLRRERTSILPVFKFAVTKGYIKAVPETDPPKSSNDRRPTFTQDEWRQIYTKARAWVKDGESLATWRDRFMTQQYVLILANTGLRVGELRGLRWGDLRTVKTEDGTRLIAEVRGKTGLREVVFQSGADEYVKRVYDQRCEELGSSPPPDGLVFCHKDGSAIQTMKTGFQSLLRYAGVPIERNGMARTIYSLRHFYATMRLSNDTSPFLLAKQMGTSVEMLEKFYGQTVSSQLAAQISKGNQSGGGSVKAYPFE